MQCVYFVITVALPPRVNFLSEAAHIATLHAAVFLVVALCLGASASVVHGPPERLPEFYPLSPRIADSPLLFVTVANALLLPVLGLEAWLRDELGSTFSVVTIVQMLGGAEAFSALTVAGFVTCESRRASTRALLCVEGGDGRRAAPEDRAHPQTTAASTTAASTPIRPPLQSASSSTSRSGRGRAKGPGLQAPQRPRS